MKNQRYNTDNTRQNNIINQDETSQDKARQHKTRQCQCNKQRQYMARQDKHTTRIDNTKQSNTDT